MINDAMKQRESVELFRAVSAILAASASRTGTTSGSKNFSSSLKEPMKSSKQRGFSLLELMIVIAIGMVMAGVTFIAMVPVLKGNHVDSAYDTTLSVIRNYRTLSITQSRRYIVTFTAPGTITVQLWPVGVPTSPPPVTVATFTLPSDIQFAVQGGFPAPPPDNFGTGVTAIDFDQGMGLGSQNYIMFMPDGSSQDTLGNYDSGVVYLVRPGEIYSSRAVTVFGTTGRVRGWRINNQAGNKWVQQ
jgi:prepilin-type N-terminal cleavage/methylation domain-containing protein